MFTLLIARSSVLIAHCILYGPYNKMYKCPIHFCSSPLFLYCYFVHLCDLWFCAFENWTSSWTSTLNTVLKHWKRESNLSLLDWLLSIYMQSYNRKLECETCWIKSHQIKKMFKCSNVKPYESDSNKQKKKKKRGSMVNYDAVMQLNNKKIIHCLLLCTQSAVFLANTIYTLHTSHKMYQNSGESEMSISVI